MISCTTIRWIQWFVCSTWTRPEMVSTPLFWGIKIFFSQDSKWCWYSWHQEPQNWTRFDLKFDPLSWTTTCSWCIAINRTYLSILKCLHNLLSINFMGIFISITGIEPNRWRMASEQDRCSLPLAFAFRNWRTRAKTSFEKIRGSKHVAPSALERWRNIIKSVMISNDYFHYKIFFILIAK